MPLWPYIAEGRDEAALDGFWEGLSGQQKENIEAVAMDMWKPYINATRAQLYGAEEKIVHDPFHLHRHMNGGGKPSAQTGACDSAQTRR